MRATPYPNPDQFDPLNERCLARTIELAFGADGIDGFEGKAGLIYSAEWKRPYVCALTEEAVVGGWLGTSQWQISEGLTKLCDRAWVSRARHEGRISLDLFLRLEMHPDRPKNSPVSKERLRPWMYRSASIAIARAISERFPSKFNLSAQFLSELNYELGCVVIGGDSRWHPINRDRSGIKAVTAIKDVCSTMDVIPTWYTEIRRRQTISEINHVTQDAGAALQRLEYLSEHWRGILHATAQLMESIRARESKNAA
jgi:hypothetical protein